MTKEEHIAIVAKPLALTEPFHVMATKAYHQMGDISSEVPDLAYITGESGDYYIGMWVYGFGFFNVLFPKNTVRDLSEAEIAEYNQSHLSLNGNYLGKLTVHPRQ